MLYRIGFSNTFHVTPLYYRFPRTHFDTFFDVNVSCCKTKEILYILYIYCRHPTKKKPPVSVMVWWLWILTITSLYMTKLNLFSFQRFQFTFLSIQYLSISKNHIAIHLCKFNGSRAGFWKQERLWCCLYFEKLRYYKRSGWRWWGSIILYFDC